MVYVFDTNSISVLGNYYPKQFPSFWKQFNQAVEDLKKIISVKEAHRELDKYNRHQHLSIWIENHKGIFYKPTVMEMIFVSDIFSVKKFKPMIRNEHISDGKPCADPFIIAAAKLYNGCVVTEEKEKPNAAQIPNVCQHFGIDFTNLQGFMEREDWSF